MDVHLPKRQQELLEFGRSLADAFDRDYWHAHVDERGFPFELWAAIGDAGHLGTLVPAACGGAGGSLLDLALLAEGIAAAGFPLLTMITGPGLGLPAIARHGSDQQRTKILPDLLSGRSVLAFAITEAETGGNLARLATRAVPDGERWLLSGTKSYTSLADVAEHVLVVARTPGPQPDRDGFTLFLIPTDVGGFEIEPMDTRVAMPERQCQLRFDAVSLGAEHLVGDPGRALQVLLPGLVAERVVSAALSCGLGQHALDLATDYTRSRTVFDDPIAAHQGVQHPLARACIRVEAARLLVRRAAELADAGERADGIANMAVFAAGEAGFEASDTALQAHGGYGYTQRADLYASHQLARLLRSAPVHAESALNAVGELVLGLPRSY